METLFENFKAYEKLKEHEVYAIAREDGMSMAVTKDPDLLEQIISDKFCQARVTMDRAVFNKQDRSYSIFATIFEGGDGQGCGYEFTMVPTALYKKPAIVHDLLTVADILRDDVGEDIRGMLKGRHIYADRFLDEQLYALDMFEGEEHGPPKKLRGFIDRVREEAPDAAYFRLI